MEDQDIEFVVFPHGSVWKLYRDEELVCIYSTKGEAESAASGFVSSLNTHGKRAVLRTLATTQDAMEHGLRPDQ